MESRPLGTTTLEGIRRLGVAGRRAQDSWHQIDAYLRTALGPEHARLFAEPVGAAEGKIAWYAAGDAEPRRIDALSEPERTALIERFETLYREVKAHGAKLRGSKSPSEQRMGAILEGAVGFTSPEGVEPLFSVGGQPVLVSWGTQLDSNDAPGDPLTDFMERQRRRLAVRPKAPEPLPPVPEAPKPAPPPPPPPIPPAMVVVRRDWAPLAAIGAWLLFAVLVGTLFFTVLAPCGVAGLTGLRLCPAVRVAAASPAETHAAALQAEIRALEDALARAPTCAVDEPEPPPPPPPPPEPQAAPEPEPEPVEPPPLPQSEFDQLREQEGGQSGEVTITLRWRSSADLDLHVVCPDGTRIYYSQPRGCGGVLDIDRNKDPYDLDNPAIENIYFGVTPGSGTYQVVVHKYPAALSLGRPFDMFTDDAFDVEVTVGRDRRTYSGRVSLDKYVTVTEFSIP